MWQLTEWHERARFTCAYAFHHRRRDGGTGKRPSDDNLPRARARRVRKMQQNTVDIAFDILENEADSVTSLDATAGIRV